jgi:hypothetical protein
MDAWEPEPIDDDKLVQVLVEYIGEHRASVRWAPKPHNRGYWFSNDPRERLQWVPADEEAWFAALPLSFRVHTDRRINPVVDRQRAVQAELDLMRDVQAALYERIDNLSASSSAVVRRGGRPPVDPDVVLKTWHLKRHLGWTYVQIAEFQRVDGSNPEATLSERLRRAEKSGVVPPQRECQFCSDGWLPPPPE